MRVRHSTPHSRAIHACLSSSGLLGWGEVPVHQGKSWIGLSSKLGCFTAANKILGPRHPRKLVANEDFLGEEIQGGHFYKDDIVH